MKKNLSVVLMVLVMAMNFSFASGTKEAAKTDSKNVYGTKKNPVTVTYLCKDVNPEDFGTLNWFL
jgi:uncharacterized lipoprotein YehR (DUF1307 family)